MAQYKVKKEYIVSTCIKTLDAILKTRQKKIEEYEKEYQTFSWFKKNFSIEYDSDVFRINLYKHSISYFCEKHITSCLNSVGSFVIMDETEINIINELWKEYCYDLKK